MFKFKKAKSNPLALDPYVTRGQRNEKAFSPDTIYESGLLSYVATFLFVVIDFICLYTVWNTVQTESAYLVRLLALGCAVCLDVPMAIAAIALKKKHQGLMSKKSADIIAFASIATFAITFVFALCFRMVTKDLTFDINSGSTMQNTLATSNSNISSEGSNAVITAALFSGIIPLCTSIASFVITYFGIDPIKQKLKFLYAQRIQLQTHDMDLDMALREATEAISYKNFLIDREKQLFLQYIDECLAGGAILKNATRQAIMEKVSSPDDVNVLTESGHAINKNTESELTENMPDLISEDTTNLDDSTDTVDTDDSTINNPISEEVA